MKTNKLLKSIMLGGLCTVAILAYAEQVKVVRVYNGDKVIATHKISDFEFLQVEDVDAAELLPAKVTTYEVNGVSFDMVEVEGGNYLMGDDNSSNANEKPAHKETIATFQIGKTEVTQELWEAVMGSNPSNSTDEANLPVEKVSWTDCNTFIAKLNELTGKSFRLPTEAEWEYAARGGNKSQGYTFSGSNTLEDVAWCLDNSSMRTHSVAQKQPNELGIYDMSGNVCEWTSDKYSSDYSSERTGSERVIRGGDIYNDVFDSGVAYRYGTSESTNGFDIGFRLAL